MRASTPLCLEEQKFDPEHQGPGANCRSCPLLCRIESWFEARNVQHVCPFWGRGMRVDTPPCLPRGTENRSGAPGPRSNVSLKLILRRNQLSTFSLQPIVCRSELSLRSILRRRELSFRRVLCRSKLSPRPVAFVHFVPQRTTDGGATYAAVVRPSQSQSGRWHPALS